MKHLMWCAIAQAFTRAVVQVVHRIINLISANFKQVGGLGKELTQQAVVVLIEPALPGTVGVRKVHLCLQTSGDELMLSELFAVVKSQGLALGFVRAQQLYHRRCDLVAVTRVQLGCQGVA